MPDKILDERLGNELDRFAKPDAVGVIPLTFLSLRQDDKAGWFKGGRGGGGDGYANVNVDRLSGVRSPNVPGESNPSSRRIGVVKYAVGQVVGDVLDRGLLGVRGCSLEDTVSVGDDLE